MRLAPSSTVWGQFSSFSKNAPRTETAVSAWPDCGIFDEFEYRSTNQLLTTATSLAVAATAQRRGERRARATVDRRDFRGLIHLRAKLGSRFKAGALLYTGANTVTFVDRLAAVPLSGLWSP